MSYLFELVAPSSERASLELAAQRASAETGLLILVDPAPRFLKRWDRTCTVLFHHEEVSVDADDIHESEPRWVTRPD